MTIREIVANSSARRLLFVIGWLALADAFVPAILGHLERSRYEGSGTFRFEGSDFFGLGPTVEYLRANPRSEKRRVVFLGNSVLFGFQLNADEAPPAAFASLNPETRVLNLSINNLPTGSSYLIAKQIAPSVDSFYVMLSGTGASANLAELIPVDESDRRRFGLIGPDRTENALRQFASVWRLYRDSYRLQQAAFGSSARMYLYQNKTKLPRRLLATVLGRPLEPSPAPDASLPNENVRAMLFVSERQPSPDRAEYLRTAYPLVWDFAQAIRDHGKRVVFLHFPAFEVGMPAVDLADLNALLGPQSTVLQVRVPVALTLDRQHFTAAGARSFARALMDPERTYDLSR